MKNLALSITATVIVLSALGLFCAIASCRYFCGLPEDFYDFPDGRIIFSDEPPYAYIPTYTPKEPFPIIPISPEDLTWKAWPRTIDMALIAKDFG